MKETIYIGTYAAALIVSHKFLESSRRIFTRAKELALSEGFLFSVLMNAKRGNIFSF